MAVKKETAQQAAEAATQDDKASQGVQAEKPATEVIHLFKDNGRYSSARFVSVNGEAYLIQRGVDVEVPAAVAEVLRGTDIMVLSDEIYAELNYGLRPHVSIATLPGMAERTIVVNGFSKSYAMTGWRLGYACGPEPIIKIMTKIHQSAIMSAPTTSQYAAITALKECDGEIDRMRDEYNMRRRLVVRSFNDMGLTCFEPRGAFYAFPCIKSTGMSSQEFCTKLLEQKHVAIIPGDAFGASGEGYCRVSYAYSVEHLTEALKRIREFLVENNIYHGN